jgi:hypothetical protein
MVPIIVRVYVSSTWLDLQPERQAVEQALQQMRETKFVGMEHFGSSGEGTRQASLDELDRSDAYVGIFGERYGSGITEAEYRRARERRLPCFIYHKKLEPAQGHDPDLVALKTEHFASHLIRPPFTSPEQLAYYVTSDLHRWLFDVYLAPRLERAADGAGDRDEAAAILAAIPDPGALDPTLRARLRAAGFVLASAPRSIAIGGSVQGGTFITGDGNHRAGT